MLALKARRPRPRWEFVQNTVWGVTAIGVQLKASDILRLVERMGLNGRLADDASRVHVRVPPTRSGASRPVPSRPLSPRLSMPLTGGALGLGWRLQTFCMRATSWRMLRSRTALTMCRAACPRPTPSASSFRSTSCRTSSGAKSRSQATPRPSRSPSYAQSVGRCTHARILTPRNLRARTVLARRKLQADQPRGRRLGRDHCEPQDRRVPGVFPFARPAPRLNPRPASTPRRLPTGLFSDAHRSHARRCCPACSRR